MKSWHQNTGKLLGNSLTLGYVLLIENTTNKCIGPALLPSFLLFCGSHEGHITFNLLNADGQNMQSCHGHRFESMVLISQILLGGHTGSWNSTLYHNINLFCPPLHFVFRLSLADVAVLRSWHPDLIFYLFFKYLSNFTIMM